MYHTTVFPALSASLCRDNYIDANKALQMFWDAHTCLDDITVFMFSYLSSDNDINIYQFPNMFVTDKHWELVEVRVWFLLPSALVSFPSIHFFVTWHNNEVTGAVQAKNKTWESTTQFRILPWCSGYRSAELHIELSEALGHHNNMTGAEPVVPLFQAQESQICGWSEHLSAMTHTQKWNWTHKIVGIDSFYYCDYLTLPFQVGYFGVHRR